MKMNMELYLRLKLRPYKLLALDHPATKATLYNRVPENIKRILRRNYGYTMSGSRDSELDSDLALSQHLCEEGYEGYATNFMQTDTGEFHPEFMICNVDGMRPLGRITNDPTKVANILRRGEIDRVSRDLKVSRKGKQRTESPYVARAPLSPFASFSSRGASYGSPVVRSSSKKLTFDDMDTDNQENITPNLFNSGLFGDDSDDEDKRGGLRKRKRRSYKKRKTRTNKRKRSSRTRRRR